MREKKARSSPWSKRMFTYAVPWRRHVWILCLKSVKTVLNQWASPTVVACFSGMCYYKETTWRSKVNSNIELCVVQAKEEDWVPDWRRLKCPVSTMWPCWHPGSVGLGTLSVCSCSQPLVQVSPGGPDGASFSTIIPWLPLPWNGDPTLIPAHIVVGGSKTNVAEADWLLAILAIVA